jgi:hypothetical protein
MKYFILPDKQGHKIMKVRQEDVDGFRRKYQWQIMPEAGSIADLMVLFSAKMEEWQEKKQE